MDKLITNQRERLFNVPLPQATDTYAPVSHKQVIEMTLEAFDQQNLKIIDESYSLARESRQAVGSYGLQFGTDPDMALKVMWNNSYDKSTTLKWAIGGHVFVCSNGMVCGDMGSFKRKHTGLVLSEYSNTIKTYVSEAGEIFEQLIVDKEKMKDIQITRRTTAELLGRMFLEDKCITATQLGIIKNELEAPTHDYKAKDTAWELYNHVTFSLKEAHPQHSIKQHIDTHQFFAKEYGL